MKLHAKQGGSRGFCVDDLVNGGTLYTKQVVQDVIANVTFIIIFVISILSRVSVVVCYSCLKPDKNACKHILFMAALKGLSHCESIHVKHVLVIPNLHRGALNVESVCLFTQHKLQITRMIFLSLFLKAQTAG